MKNTGDAVERVLTGLRDAEAPVGMERRILARLEDGGSDPARADSRAGWRWPLWFVTAARPAVVRYVVMGCAAAGVIAVVLAIPGKHHRQDDPAKAAKAKTGSVVKGPSTPVVEEAVIRSDQVGPALMRAARVANEPEGPAIAENEGGDLDAVAMSETKAASFPAPAMPLTEQERLLLRMLHHGESVELAMLDPQLAALQDAKEKEEFQRSFMKPEVKVDELAATPTAEGIGPAPETMEQTNPEKTAPADASSEQTVVKEGTPQLSTTQESTTVEKQ